MLGSHLVWGRESVPRFTISIGIHIQGSEERSCGLFSFALIEGGRKNLRRSTTLGPADPPIDLRRSLHTLDRLSYLSNLCVVSAVKIQAHTHAGLQISPLQQLQGTFGRRNLSPVVLLPPRPDRCGLPMICNACSGGPGACRVDAPAGTLIQSIVLSLTAYYTPFLASPQASHYKSSASLHHVPYLAPHTFRQSLRAA